MRSKWFKILCVATILYAGSVRSASAEDRLYYASAKGDYIGAGKTVSLTTKHGSFTSSSVYGDATGRYAQITFQGNDPAIWWTLNLAAPLGQILKAGTYKNATRFPFQSDSNPGLDFSGSGRGCNQLYGSFTIHEIEFGADNAASKVVVDFEQHCEGISAPALRGSLSFHSSSTGDFADDDNDGIANIRDDCSLTPASKSVDKHGCSKAQFCEAILNKNTCRYADWNNDVSPTALEPRDCRFTMKAKMQGICKAAR